MEALLAAIMVYLGIGLHMARDVAVPGAAPGLGPQLRIACAVLAAGLFWPREYWRMLKEDWDNYYLDAD